MRSECIALRGRVLNKFSFYDKFYLLSAVQNTKVNENIFMDRGCYNPTESKSFQ
jgi:hypothetical protein